MVGRGLLHMHWLIWVAAFLLGSVPTGYLVVYFSKGLNIQKVGSGNIGSTNVARVAGKRMALLTQGIDLAKGALATSLAILWNNAHPTPFLVAGAAALVIIGNSYTPFLRFKGGKGVNTTAGAFIPLFPWAVLLAFIGHLTLRKFTGLVSLSSITAGVILLSVTLLIYGWSEPIWALIVAFALVCWRHKENIKRLAQGKEARERK